MKNLKSIGAVFSAIFAMLVSAQAAADDSHVAQMEELAQSTVKNWIADASVISAVKAQNEMHAGLEQADIDAMDRKWREETGASNHPMIDEVMGREVSAFLKNAK